MTLRPVLLLQMPEKLREGMTGFKDRQMRRFSLPTSSRGLLRLGAGAGAAAGAGGEPRRSSVASVCSTACTALYIDLAILLARETFNAGRLTMVKYFGL